MTFFIDQHGCAKNQVDGELICTRLTECGYEQIFDAEKADIIIINSCGFIESAKKESLDAVYEARKQNPAAKILLAGCLAERYADVFANELPEADAIFGNGDVLRIDEIVGKMMAKKNCAASGSRSASESRSASGDAFASGGRSASGSHSATRLPVLKLEQKGVCSSARTNFLSYRGAAFVKVTEGCNNCCTFCAIPLIRGSLRSRRESEIVTEIEKLVSQGFYEINLIGQDLAAYGTGDDDDVQDRASASGSDSENGGVTKSQLPELDASGKNLGTKTQSALAHLLERISQLDGCFRLRLLYIHPDHFNRDILPVIKNDSRIVPYFDIPFQSGSDTIIHAMNRKGNAKEYKRLVDDIRKELPDAAIRTTFLTGFPGESDDDANATREFLCSIESDWSGCFTYSREEDTPAYNMKKRVTQKIAKARADELQKLQAEITARRLHERIGKEYDVLIEEVVDASNAASESHSASGGNNSASGSPSDDGVMFAIGRAWFQAPEVDGSVVVRFDKDDRLACDAIKPGNVVRVFADGVNGVDVDARFLRDAFASGNQSASAGRVSGESDLLFAPEES